MYSRYARATKQTECVCDSVTSKPHPFTWNQFSVHPKSIPWGGLGETSRHGYFHCPNRAEEGVKNETFGTSFQYIQNRFVGGG